MLIGLNSANKALLLDNFFHCATNLPQSAVLCKWVIMSSKYSKSDLIKLAIEEHLKCVEFPRVGVVIAKSGEVLATGYRGETKDVHAERVAIRKLTDEEIQGATGN